MEWLKPWGISGMDQDDINGVYRDKIILDHCRNPRNQTQLQLPDKTGEAINHFCGDEVHLDINFDVSGHVSDVFVMAEGCAINQASSSILSEAIKGLSLADMLKLYRKFTCVMNGNTKLKQLDSSFFDDLSVMYGVRKFPVRIKCVLLSWMALYKIVSKT